MDHPNFFFFSKDGLFGLLGLLGLLGLVFPLELFYIFEDPEPDVHLTVGGTKVECRYKFSYSLDELEYSSSSMYNSTFCWEIINSCAPSFPAC